MSIFDQAHEKADIWLNDMMTAMGTNDRRVAGLALRAGLHAVRDRLPVDEAAQLGAQLPLLVRGLYYDGWRPAATPVRARHVDEFLALIEGRMRDGAIIDPEIVARAIFRVLGHHLSRGELEAVLHVLPHEIERFVSTS